MKSVKFKIFLTVLSAYLFYIAPDYITATTNRYIILTKSIVEDRTFYIDKYSTATRDIAPYKDHIYIGAAPGLSFLAVPIYIVSKPILRLLPAAIYQDLEFNILNLLFTFFLAVLPGAAIASLLYSILEEFDLKKKEKLLVVFTATFGTILFYYSTRFTAHTMGAFVLLSAFYIAFRSRDIRNNNAGLFFLAGIFLGMAVLLEYILGVGSALIMLYAFFNFKKERLPSYIALLVGIVLMAIIYIYYHYKCFDNPFASAATYNRLIGPIPLRLPRLEILYELTFGVYRGLFAYMPIFLVAIYGIFAFFGQSEKKYLPEMALISLYSLLTFFSVSIFCSKVWPLGGDFGPRYLISFIPFLIIPIAFAYRKIKYEVVFWIAAASIFINWCGVQYGDADNVFTDIGLFIFGGLNSDLAQFTYKLTTTYIRKLNVITHFSPLIPFAMLMSFLYTIWKDDLKRP